jgi:hypothetical protein
MASTLLAPTTATTPITTPTNTTGSGFQSTLTAINGTLNILGSVGLSALQNKGVDLKGKYDTELAKIALLQQTNAAQYAIEKAKIDATYGAQADDLKAKAKRQLILVIALGVVALCAVVGTMVYLFRRK